MLRRDFTACLTLQGQQPSAPTGLLCRFDGDVHTMLLFSGETRGCISPAQWAADTADRLQQGKAPDGRMPHYAALSLRKGEDGLMHGTAHSHGRCHALLWTPTDGLCHPSEAFRVTSPFWVAVMDEDSCRSLATPRKLADAVADACRSAASPREAEAYLQQLVQASGPVGIALYGLPTLADDRLRAGPRRGPQWDALMHHQGGMC